MEMYCSMNIKVKEFIIEAISGCILWTFLLTPYMIWITKMTTAQYLSWIVMEIILILPLAPVVYRITKLIKKKLIDGDN